MLDKKYYWPMIKKHVKGKISPRAYIPSKYMYADKEGTDAFNAAANGRQYWLSWDSALCIDQNKEYLAGILKDYTILELGGFDGSALNTVFAYGSRRKIKFQYINDDLGDGVLLLMKKNFQRISNVNFSLVKDDFDKIGFITRIRTSKSKAILFLGNTFGNYLESRGDSWLKDLYKSMSARDIFILGFDRRVSAQKHLECYNIHENGHMTMLAARNRNFPIDNLHAGTIFDRDGIHGGVIVIKDFVFNGKKYKKDDFIEVFLSLKLTLKKMILRVNKAGFIVIKILKSKNKHIYHLVLAKNKNLK